MTLKYEFSIWGGEGEGVAEIDEESEELETAMEGVDNGEEVGKSWEELGVRPLAKMKAAARMAILDFGAPGIFSNNPRNDLSLQSLRHIFSGVSQNAPPLIHF